MNELLVDKLKKARAEKKLKQQEVAEELGVKANTISNWEKGRTEPNIDSFVRLCDIYQLDCAALLSDVYAFKRIETDISLSEYEHIKKYRALDQHGKKIVDMVLEEERARQITEQAKADTVKESVPEHLILNAAHAIEGAAPEDIQHDEDIMDDENF